MERRINTRQLVIYRKWRKLEKNFSFLSNFRIEGDGRRAGGGKNDNATRITLPPSVSWLPPRRERNKQHRAGTNERDVPSGRRESRRMSRAHARGSPILSITPGPPNDIVARNLAVTTNNSTACPVKHDIRHRVQERERLETIRDATISVPLAGN